MQYIKITTDVNLSSGLSIPPNSIVIIAEGYLDVKSAKKGEIPCQISTLCYASVEAFLEGKENVVGISDFNTSFSNLSLSVNSYETQAAEPLCINAVFDALTPIYGTNLEVCSTPIATN
jgi:hypothetical protein